MDAGQTPIATHTRQRIAELEGYLAYIDKKDALYRDILDGRIPYVSNLIEEE